MNILLNLIAVLASLGLCGCHPVVESSSESGNAAAGRNEIPREMQNYIATEPGTDTFNRGRRLEDCRANYHQPSEEFRKCTASIPIDGDWGVPPEILKMPEKISWPISELPMRGTRFLIAQSRKAGCLIFNDPIWSLRSKEHLPVSWFRKLSSVSNANGSSWGENIERFRSSRGGNGRMPSEPGAS